MKTQQSNHMVYTFTESQENDINKMSLETLTLLLAREAERKQSTTNNKTKAA